MRRIMLAGVCMLAVISMLHAQQSKPAEYQVKAAYLYNFGRFVGWPPKIASDRNDSFPICVLGQDPFGAILDQALSDASINGKHLVTRRITKPADASN